MNNDFQLLEQLGRGGMGVVWKARERATGRLVAIKVMHANFASDPGYRQRFEREVEIARRLHSPNIVEVLGYGSDDGTPYMVMELVEGESLRELLARRGHLGWDETRAILRQAAIALDVAHRANVIHRDVKPSNILMTADGTVKLADFGIARAGDLTALTGSSTMLGTSAYMAPDLDASEQGDFYSLGCVAYEMLTGRQVFEGSSQQAVVIRHIKEAPDLTEIPPEARSLVSWLLRKNAADRPAEAAALRAVLDGSRRPTSRTVLRGRMRKGPMVLAAVSGGLVAAIALPLALVFGLASGGPGSTPAATSTAATVTSPTRSGSTVTATPSSSATATSGAATRALNESPTPAESTTPTPSTTAAPTQTQPSETPRTKPTTWTATAPPEVVTRTATATPEVVNPTATPTPVATATQTTLSTPTSTPRPSVRTVTVSFSAYCSLGCTRPPDLFTHSVTLTATGYSRTETFLDSRDRVVTKVVEFSGVPAGTYRVQDSEGCSVTSSSDNVRC